MAAPHPPHIFPMFCRRRRQTSGRPFRPCRPFPRSVRPLPWTVNRRTTLRVVNLPTEIDSESRPTIRHRPLPSRAPRRVFAEGDCYRSLGFLYPRTHGRATSPAHFTGVLPPQAAKHRAVHCPGRPFPRLRRRTERAPIREYGRGVPVPGVMPPGYGSNRLWRKPTR